MEDAEYARMRACEDSHWWYRGLRAHIAEELKDRPFSRGIDLGCGTGANLSFLRKAAPSAVFYGLDRHPEAVRLTKLRGESSLIQANINELPLVSGSFDFLLCADVLYHQRVSEKETLREIFRVLKPGGKIFLNLPAFEILRGRHDRAVGTARRYTLDGLKDLLRAAGFRVAKIFYWNMIFFLPVLGVRVISRLFSTGKKSDLSFKIPGNEILTRLILWERKFSEKGLCPFGTSLFAVCEKPATGQEAGYREVQ